MNNSKVLHENFEDLGRQLDCLEIRIHTYEHDLIAIYLPAIQALNAVLRHIFEVKRDLRALTEFQPR